MAEVASPESPLDPFPDPRSFVLPQALQDAATSLKLQRVPISPQTEHIWSAGYRIPGGLGLSFQIRPVLLVDKSPALQFAAFFVNFPKTEGTGQLELLNLNTLLGRYLLLDVSTEIVLHCVLQFALSDALTVSWYRSTLRQYVTDLLQAPVLFRRQMASQPKVPPTLN